MKLVKPSKKYETSFMEAVDEYTAEGRSYEALMLHQTGSFDGMIQYYANAEKGIGLPEGYVPATEFWIVDGDKFIGRVSIRHELNDYLTNFGGHIGYAIRPSERKKGYGTKALDLGLIEAKKLGINKILITCNTTNIGSKKIIEKNGGVFEDERPKEGEAPILRYWITI